MMRVSLHNRTAFSLVEVLVSLTILGMAAAALLLASETMALNSQDAVARTVAGGIARQLLDEVASRRYMELGTSSLALPLGPDSGEKPTPRRSVLFDDIDDYHGLSHAPLRDEFGVLFGEGNGQGGTRPTEFRVPDNYFANWRVDVTVAYVDPSNPAVDLSGNATGEMRAVTVTVARSTQGTWETLAQQRRVFSYVPPL